MKDQTQEAGAGSTNVQAGGNVTVNVNGVDRVEAMEIAHTVAKWEVEHYHSLAWTTVSERLNEFRERLIERIERLESRLLNSFADPDVQMCISDAQRNYARSGRDDVGRVLVDLIADRCGAEPDGFQAMVISGAIDAVGKLPRRAIAALTVHFLIMNARGVGIRDIDSLVRWLEHSIGPYLPDLPTRDAEYGLITSAGVAEIGAFKLATDENDLRKRIYGTYVSAFQVGVLPSEIDPPLAQEIARIKAETGYSILRTSSADPNKVCIDIGVGDPAEDLLKVANVPLEPYISLMARNALSEPAAIAELEARFSGWALLEHAWNSTPLRYMSPTSIGTAIAHANWSNLTNGSAPLSIWIPED